MREARETQIFAHLAGAGSGCFEAQLSERPQRQGRRCPGDEVEPEVSHSAGAVGRESGFGAVDDEVCQALLHPPGGWEGYSDHQPSTIIGESHVAQVSQV